MNILELKMVSYASSTDSKRLVLINLMKDLKTNMEDFTYSIDNFKKYKPKKYDWKQEEVLWRKKW